MIGDATSDPNSMPRAGIFDDVFTFLRRLNAQF